MVDPEKVNRLRALFKSGSDKFQSFFVVLNEVKAEIGDTALPGWCFSELHIGFSVIERVAGILVKAEEEKIKEELRVAREAEKDQLDKVKYDRNIEREIRKRKIEEEKTAASRARDERRRIEEKAKRRRSKMTAQKKPLRITAQAAE